MKTLPDPRERLVLDASRGAKFYNLSAADQAAIDANHARLAAIGDRGHTRDLFAEHAGSEDLVLIGERILPTTIKAVPAPPHQLTFF